MRAPKNVISARLDAATRRAYARIAGSAGSRRIIGLGAFDSGRPDLATDERNLHGFGSSAPFGRVATPTPAR